MKHLRCVHGMGDHAIGDEIKVSDAEAAYRLELRSSVYKCYDLVADLGPDEPVAPAAPAEPAEPTPVEPEPVNNPVDTETPAEVPAGKKAKKVD